MAIAAKARNIAEDIERRLGFEPEDVEFDRKGWDVQSKVGDGSQRFIEVKGRDSMGETITVTHNETNKDASVRNVTTWQWSFSTLTEATTSGI